MSMTSVEPARESRFSGLDDRFPELIPRSPRPADEPTDFIFYTNRCGKCGRALTKLDIINRMSDPRGLCTCGSNRFYSTTFKWWEELLLIRSWRMYFAIRKGILRPPPSAEDMRGARRIAVQKAFDMAASMEGEEDQ